jgi:hypothetical protein
VTPAMRSEANVRFACPLRIASTRRGVSRGPTRRFVTLVEPVSGSCITVATNTFPDPADSLPCGSAPILT